MRLTNYRELIYELYTEPKLLANPPKVLGKRRHNPPRINFVKNNVPHNCVGAEVGVAGGKNAKWLWDYTEPTQLYLIDHWDEPKNGNYYFGTKENTLQEYNKILEWSKDKNIELIKNDTIKAANLFDDNSLDWIYLDANHSYDGVLGDLKAWWPKIKNGGFLFGDDYSIYDLKSDETFGVERALNDFFSEDTSIYLESQGVDNSRVDKNDKPLVAYSYSITKKSQ